MPTGSGPRMGVIAIVLVALIGCYRLTLSYVLGGRCRFYPSCSIYGQQALRRHGACRGLWLIIKRLSRCHPWHAGGLDPVP